jgi:hypothetical protein
VADAPWRCSECGTVNEPVATSCRTCGRWPSLFDLESNKLEIEEPPSDVDRFEARTADVDEVEEVEEVEPDVVDAGMPEVELPPEFEADDSEAAPRVPGWRRFARLVVPVGVVLYILISALADRG